MSSAAGNGIERARALVAAALDVAPESIDADAEIAGLPGFDSLAYERLVAATEEELGRELDPFAMVSVETVAELGRMLETER